MTGGATPGPNPKTDNSKATPPIRGLQVTRAGANLSEYRNRVLQNFINLRTNAALTQVAIPPSPSFQLHPSIAFSNGYPPISIARSESSAQIAQVSSRLPVPLPAPATTPLPLSKSPSNQTSVSPGDSHSSLVEPATNPRADQRLVPSDVKKHREVCSIGIMESLVFAVL